ncbi:MAG TPA: linear amide C-N hydrolase [Fluviicola sp.]|nr:linear amide C-N hydrolase [Fluviicola sp.]
MCTRVTYMDEDKAYTARNFDWSDWSEAGLWVYPSGIVRNAAAGSQPMSWKSRYKSVATSSYNGATPDGLNEKGLAANLLWLAPTKYPALGSDKRRKPICVSIWAQYILDMCKDVPGAIEAMNSVYVVSAKVPGTSDPVECHLSVSDREGNSAIFEYVNAQLVIYTNVDYVNADGVIVKGTYTKQQLRVMTNQPTFNEQLKLNAEWEKVNQTEILPGTCSPVDRFVRATYYTKLLPLSTPAKKLVPTEALSHLVSVLRNTVEPFEITVNPDEVPSPTQYTTMCDHTKGIYYFNQAKNPLMSWVDLNDFEFSKITAGSNRAFSLSFKDGGALLADGSLGGGKLNAGNFQKERAFDFVPHA